ncbi:MAG: hypothetical protein PT944_00945 [Actinomycetaceae bacterium]|nr:hypothetical protein [Arcanobacterium sp.]MDD7686474.1 hypothetical protein [Actinomycetaceae bacterium]MDY5272754.1 hypothetical protein [Arcanobacterium sp.]
MAIPEHVVSMRVQIDPGKVAAVQRACDKNAWLYAESGGKDGIVPVIYKVSRRHTSEEIFARIVRLWHAIDRPNVQIQLVASELAQGVLRRTKNTAIRMRIIDRAAE